MGNSLERQSAGALSSWPDLNLLGTLDIIFLGIDSELVASLGSVEGDFLVASDLSVLNGVSLTSFMGGGVLGDTLIL